MHMQVELDQEPVFGNNNVDITKQMAQKIGHIYSSLKDRGEAPDKAHRFVLQLVVALFAEDVGLVPELTLQRILKHDASATPQEQNHIAKNELEKLFKSMSTDKAYQKDKSYKSIAFFNGGVFKAIEPLDLSFSQWRLLYKASQQDWSRVRPSIFGSIFESGIDKKVRHGSGIHYTSELDIQKIVGPTIIEPLKKQLEHSNTIEQLQAVLKQVQNFKVLDPACGSGNFLYIAFCELRKLEGHIVELLRDKGAATESTFGVSARNFYGIDTNGFGLELAKVALSIGRKLSSSCKVLVDSALPFDDLDANFIADDALFVEWPQVDAVIGNPPFLGAKKIRIDHDHDYVARLRQQFSELSAMVDYCVYWFYKTHQHLKPGQRAGLVGTNSIRETNSRAGSLEYIVKNGGTVFNAVSSQVWSGEANVHVSIVNWIKGPYHGPKILATQLGSQVHSPWQVEEVSVISSSLTSGVSVADAKRLKTNSTVKHYFQGQVTGTKKFYVSKQKADEFLQQPKNKDVVWPVLGGKQLVTQIAYKADKFVIDFGQRDMLQAASYKEPFEYAKQIILPVVKKSAASKTGVPIERERHLGAWWRLRRPRGEMTQRLKSMQRYIALSRTVKKPLIFEFVSSAVRPADALQVFAFDDDYSFGILQSSFHTQWAEARGGSMGEGVRYTADDVFLSFPWPQNASPEDVQGVDRAAQNLLQVRAQSRRENRWGLRELYKTLELEGQNPLKHAHHELDAAVWQAYGANSAEEGPRKHETCDMKSTAPRSNKVIGSPMASSAEEGPRKGVEFLMKLNEYIYGREQEGLSTRGPGRPIVQTI